MPLSVSSWNFPAATTMTKSTLSFKVSLTSELSG
jgi:hypothetical protein